jgi:hypothetical protein
MKQKDILNNKIVPCSIYHALHIDFSKWKYYKVGHIDGKRSLEQSYGV